MALAGFDRLVTRTGWAVIAGLVLVTIVRLTHWSDTKLLVAVLALTPIWYFLAWPILALATWRRRWSLAAAAAAAVIVQVIIVVPVWNPESHAAAADGAWRLTVFDANVRYTNLNLTGIGRQIAADHPDLVALEGLSDGNAQSLARTGALNGYPHRLVRLDSMSNGFGVWSKVAISDLTIWQIFQHSEVQAVLHPPGQPAVNLLVIHTLAPRGAGQPGIWNTQMSQIAAKVRSEPRPLIVVGDFNATSDMRQFTAISDQHLTDAAVATGQGWRMTWPANKRPIPPLIRIDHLLYSPGLTVTRYRLGSNDGSDHRPLLITLAKSR